MARNSETQSYSELMVRSIHPSIMIARGLVKGSYLFGAFSSITTGGTVSDVIVNHVDLTEIPDTEGAQFTIVSSSQEDSVGGTGVNSVRILYLNDRLEQLEEDVDLNGTTSITTVADNIRFIQCVSMLSVGSGLSAIGDITVSFNGIATNRIPSGKVSCESSVRMVPRGKRMFLSMASASSTSGSSQSEVDIQICKNTLNGKMYNNPLILTPIMSIGLQDNTGVTNFLTPVVFEEGEIVAMRCSSSKAAKVSCVLQGWIEDVIE